MVRKDCVRGRLTRRVCTDKVHSPFEEVYAEAWVSYVRFASAVLALLLMGNAIAAQEPAGGDAPKSLTPDASLNLRFISDLQLSPDGARLAFVVSDAPKGEHRTQHIWMYDKATNSARQFTYSGKSETSPRWSPDRTRLAFLSDRGGDEQQIYVMNANSGDGVAHTKGKRSVKAFAWSPDGKYLAYLAPDAKTEEREKKEKDKDDARVVGKDEKRPRLWIQPVESGQAIAVTASAESAEAKAMTPANWEIKELAWMPSGENIVVVGTDHPESDQETDRIMNVHVSGGAMDMVSAPRGPFGEIRVAKDGKTIGYIGARENGPTPHDLMLLPVGTPAARNVTGTSLDRQIFDFKWLQDGSLLAVAGDGFHTRFVSLGADGAIKKLELAEVGNPSAFAASDAGEIFFVSQTARWPQELFAWDQKSSPRRLTHVNEAWKNYSLVAPEIYKYKSFDGTEIEAALLKPAAFDCADSWRADGSLGRHHRDLVAIARGARLRDFYAQHSRIDRLRAKIY